MAFNQPRPGNFEAPNGQVKRFVHQKLTIDHGGYRASIHENGRVTITAPPSPESDEYDEVEVPASLIFKISNGLKMTRREEFVPLASSNIGGDSGSTK